MTKRRTTSEFRLAAHGWAFSDPERLARIIERAEPLATTEEDKETIQRMKEALARIPISDR